mgnify:CR=1 FL=1
MKEKKEVRKEMEENKLWKYTDDIVAVIIIVAWIICYAIGKAMPEWIITTVLGYIFGKSFPLKK